MAGAHYGKWFVGREMRKSLLQGAGESGEWRPGRGWTDSEHRFAETIDAMSGGFEGLSDGVIQIARDKDLNGMTREERGGETIGRGEQAVLRSDAGKSFERSLREIAVTRFAGESVHANECDGGHGISAGSAGILKGLAAHFESADRRRVKWPIEKASIPSIAVAGDCEVQGFLRSCEIARIERRFVGVEQR